MGDRFYQEQAAYIKQFNKELNSVGLKTDIIEMLLRADPDLQEKDLKKQLKSDLYIHLTDLEDLIMAWTPEQKEEVIAAYKAAGPTPENSTEIIKELAEQFEQTANGVRMILVQAGAYVKKEATAAASSTGAKTASGEGTKRVSKETQIAALRAAITDAGGAVDEEILEKLTGKAAAYFAGVIAGIAK